MEANEFQMLLRIMVNYEGFVNLCLKFTFHAVVFHNFNAFQFKIGLG